MSGSHQNAHLSMITDGFPAPDFPDRYVDVRPLRTDRLAWIFAAEDSLLGRPVALKRLRPLEEAFAEADARMRREAATLARLNHPAIVQVFDVLTAPHLVLVEELVEGRNLADLVSELGSLPSPRVAAIGAVIADALAHAHSQGVLHRDLHPGDILLDQQGSPRLADFGYARWKDVAGQTLGGPVLARLDYAGPEVVRGEPADERSDVFSLGVLLFELLTGELPHPRARPFQRPESAPAPRDKAEMPEALSSLVQAMLSADPEARPDLVKTAPLLANLARSAPAPLFAISEFLSVIRHAAHPLKNRLGLVRRYPNDPEKVRALLAREQVRSETLELVRRALQGFRGCLSQLPPPLAPPSITSLMTLEKILATSDQGDPLPALAASFETVRELVDLGVQLGRKHMLPLAQWAKSWQAAGLDSPRRVLDPVEGRCHVWTADAEALTADLKEVAATLVANAAEAGAKTVTLRLSSTEEWIRLAFQDDGPGLGSEDPESLFTEGVTTKAEGSGFGLADARTRLHSHKGNLAVETGGPGARFVLTIPLRPWEDTSDR